MARKKEEVAVTEENDVNTEVPREPMVVSLAKANKIRNLVLDKIRSTESAISVATSKTIHVDQNETPSHFNEKRSGLIQKVMELIQLYGQMNFIYRSLKIAIAKANSNAEVNDIMASMEQIKLGMKPIEILTRSRTFEADTVNRLFENNKKVQEELQSNPASAGTVLAPRFLANTFPLFEENEIAREVEGLEDLRKQLRTLEEQRNELNYRTQIAIEPEIVDILVSAKII